MSRLVASGRTPITPEVLERQMKMVTSRRVGMQTKPVNKWCIIPIYWCKWRLPACGGTWSRPTAVPDRPWGSVDIRIRAGIGCIHL